MSDNVAKSFKVPKIKRQESKDNLRGVDIKSRDAQELVNTVERSFVERSYKPGWHLASVQLVDNKELEDRYRNKRAELKDEGRHSRDLADQFAFLLFRDNHMVPKIVKGGLRTRSLPFNGLGDSKLGVYLCRNADVQLRLAETWGIKACTLIIFKVTLGKCKVVNTTENTDEGIEPTPNYDCHVAQVQAKPSDTLITQLSRSQVYLYEYTDDCEPSTHPRQCLPYAVLMYERQDAADSTGYGTSKRSVSSIPSLMSRSETDAFQSSRMKRSTSYTDAADRSARLAPLGARTWSDPVLPADGSPEVTNFSTDPRFIPPELRLKPVFSLESPPVLDPRIRDPRFCHHDQDYRMRLDLNQPREPSYEPGTRPHQSIDPSTGLAISNTGYRAAHNRGLAFIDPRLSGTVHVTDQVQYGQYKPSFGPGDNSAASNNSSDSNLSMSGSDFRQRDPRLQARENTLSLTGKTDGKEDTKTKIQKEMELLSILKDIDTNLGKAELDSATKKKSDETKIKRKLSLHEYKAAARHKRDEKHKSENDTSDLKDEVDSISVPDTDLRINQSTTTSFDANSQTSNVLSSDTEVSQNSNKCENNMFPANKLQSSVADKDTRPWNFIDRSTDKYSAESCGVDTDIRSESSTAGKGSSHQAFDSFAAYRTFQGSSTESDSHVSRKRISELPLPKIASEVPEQPDAYDPSDTPVYVPTDKTKIPELLSSPQVTRKLSTLQVLDVMEQTLSELKESLPPDMIENPSPLTPSKSDKSSTRPDSHLDTTPVQQHAHTTVSPDESPLSKAMRNTLFELDNLEKCKVSACSLFKGEVYAADSHFLSSTTGHSVVSVRSDSDVSTSFRNTDMEVKKSHSCIPDLMSIPLPPTPPQKNLSGTGINAESVLEIKDSIKLGKPVLENNDKGVAEETAVCDNHTHEDSSESDIQAAVKDDKIVPETLSEGSSGIVQSTVTSEGYERTSLPGEVRQSRSRSRSPSAAGKRQISQLSATVGNKSECETEEMVTRQSYDTYKTMSGVLDERVSKDTNLRQSDSLSSTQNAFGDVDMRLDFAGLGDVNSLGDVDLRKPPSSTSLTSAHRSGSCASQCEYTSDKIYGSRPDREPEYSPHLQYAREQEHEYTPDREYGYTTDRQHESGSDMYNRGNERHNENYHMRRSSYPDYEDHDFHDQDYNVRSSHVSRDYEYNRRYSYECEYDYEEARHERPWFFHDEQRDRRAGSHPEAYRNYRMSRSTRDDVEREEDYQHYSHYNYSTSRCSTDMVPSPHDPYNERNLQTADTYSYNKNINNPEVNLQSIIKTVDVDLPNLKEILANISGATKSVSGDGVPARGPDKHEDEDMEEVRDETSNLPAFVTGLCEESPRKRGRGSYGRNQRKRAYEPELQSPYKQDSKSVKAPKKELDATANKSTNAKIDETKMKKEFEDTGEDKCRGQNKPETSDKSLDTGNHKTIKVTSPASYQSSLCTPQTDSVLPDHQISPWQLTLMKQQPDLDVVLGGEKAALTGSEIESLPDDNPVRSQYSHARTLFESDQDSSIQSSPTVSNSQLSQAKKSPTKKSKVDKNMIGYRSRKRRYKKAMRSSTAASSETETSSIDQRDTDFLNIAGSDSDDSNALVIDLSADNSSTKSSPNKSPLKPEFYGGKKWSDVQSSPKLQPRVVLVDVCHREDGINLLDDDKTSDNTSGTVIEAHVSAVDPGADSASVVEIVNDESNHSLTSCEGADLPHKKAVFSAEETVIADDASDNSAPVVLENSEEFIDDVIIISPKKLTKDPEVIDLVSDEESVIPGLDSIKPVDKKLKKLEERKQLDSNSGDISINKVKDYVTLPISEADNTSRDTAVITSRSVDKKLECSCVDNEEVHHANKFDPGQAGEKLLQISKNQAQLQSLAPEEGTVETVSMSNVKTEDKILRQCQTDVKQIVDIADVKNSYQKKTEDTKLVLSEMDKNTDVKQIEERTSRNDELQDLQTTKASIVTSLNTYKMKKQKKDTEQLDEDNLKTKELKELQIDEANPVTSHQIQKMVQKHRKNITINLKAKPKKNVDLKTENMAVGCSIPVLGQKKQPEKVIGINTPVSQSTSSAIQAVTVGKPEVVRAATIPTLQNRTVIQDKNKQNSATNLTGPKIMSVKPPTPSSAISAFRSPSPIIAANVTPIPPVNSAQQKDFRSASPVNFSAMPPLSGVVYARDIPGSLPVSVPQMYPSSQPTYHNPLSFGVPVSVGSTPVVLNRPVTPPTPTSTMPSTPPAQLPLQPSIALGPPSVSLGSVFSGQRIPYPLQTFKSRPPVVSTITPPAVGIRPVMLTPNSSVRHQPAPPIPPASQTPSPVSPVDFRQGSPFLPVPQRFKGLPGIPLPNLTQTLPVPHVVVRPQQSLSHVSSCIVPPVVQQAALATAVFAGQMARAMHQSQQGSFNRPAMQSPVSHQGMRFPHQPVMTTATGQPNTSSHLHPTTIPPIGTPINVIGGGSRPALKPAVLEPKGMPIQTIGVKPGPVEVSSSDSGRWMPTDRSSSDKGHVLDWFEDKIAQTKVKQDKTVAVSFDTQHADGGNARGDMVNNRNIRQIQPSNIEDNIIESSGRKRGFEEFDNKIVPEKKQRIVTRMNRPYQDLDQRINQLSFPGKTFQVSESEESHLLSPSKESSPCKFISTSDRTSDSATNHAETSFENSPVKKDSELDNRSIFSLARKKEELIHALAVLDSSSASESEQRDVEPGMESVSDLEDGELAEDDSSNNSPMKPVMNESVRRVVLQDRQKGNSVTFFGNNTETSHGFASHTVIDNRSSDRTSPNRIVQNVHSQKPDFTRSAKIHGHSSAASDWSDMLQEKDSRIEVVAALNKNLRSNIALVPKRTVEPKQVHKLTTVVSVTSPSSPQTSSPSKFSVKNVSDPSGGALSASAALINKNKAKLIARSQVKTLGDWLKVELEVDNIESLQKFLPYSLNTDFTTISKGRRRKIKQKVLNALETENKVAQAKPTFISDNVTSVTMECVYNETQPPEKPEVPGNPSHLPEVPRNQVVIELGLIKKTSASAKASRELTLSQANQTQSVFSSGDVKGNLSVTVRNVNTFVPRSVRTQEPGNEEQLTFISSLATVENEMGLMVQRSCFNGYPYRRVPEELLFPEEKRTYKSLEGAFLILMLPISPKPYQRLKTLKAEIERLNAKLKTNPPLTIRTLTQNELTQVHKQRLAVMRSFTGYLNKKRIRKLQDLINKYMMVYNHFKGLAPPVPDSRLQFITTTLSDLKQHLMLAKQYLAMEGQKEGLKPSLSRPDPPDYR